MKYKIELSTRAKKFLNTISERDFKLISKVIDSLGIEPYQSGIKKLKGYDSTYRVRAGNYRILYTIDGGKLIVNVVDIGDRKEIYD